MEPLIKAKFPVSYEVDEKQFLGIVKTWLEGNRTFARIFTSPKEVLESIVNQSSFIWNGLSGEVIQKESVEDENVNYAGVSFKHQGQDPNEFFETKLAFKKDNDTKNSAVSVVLDYCTSSCFHRVMDGRKPMLVNMLIEGLPNFHDGWMPIKTEPHILQSGDEFAVADVVNGIDAKNSLPIIYVSRENKNNSTTIDPNKLAKKVAGLAHVVVEPDHAFSGEVKKLLKLKEMACYDGAVRVYWPQSNNPRWNKLWIRDFLQGEAFKTTGRDSIIEIANYIASRDRALALGDCSFDQIMSISRKKNINKINRALMKMREESAIKDKDYRQVTEHYEKTVKEHAEIIALYEQDVNSLKSAKGYLEQQVRKLDDELTTTKDDLEVARNNLQDFQRFNKPQKDTNAIASHEEVILVLNDYLARKEQQGGSGQSYIEQRVTALLADRGDEVSQILEQQEKAIDEISTCFTGYDHMGSHHQKTLRKHGFGYSEDGKHYKVFKIGFNPDICVTLSKTPSDTRAGKHFAADMRRTFFTV